MKGCAEGALAGAIAVGTCSVGGGPLGIAIGVMAGAIAGFFEGGRL